MPADADNTGEGPWGLLRADFKAGAGDVQADEGQVAEQGQEQEKEKVPFSW